jgi:hypothetical protein
MRGRERTRPFPQHPPFRPREECSHVVFRALAQLSVDPSAPAEDASVRRHCDRVAPAACQLVCLRRLGKGDHCGAHAV